MMFSEIESRITFLTPISFDRALKFVLTLRDQFQRVPLTTFQANTKCSRLKRFSENTISRGIISHRYNWVV